MIIDFAIQNFGSIKERQVLSFEASKSTHLEDYYVINESGYRLLKLGLIYGANASGKTTILKALHFLRVLVLKPEDKKTDVLDYNPFLFDLLTPNQNSLLEINFLRSNIRFNYKIEFNRSAVVNEELNFHNPNKANLFKRTTDIERQVAKVNLGSKLKVGKAAKEVLEANTLWNNTVLGGFLKTNLEAEYLKDVTDWFKIHLAPMINSNFKMHSSVVTRIEKHPNEKKSIINLLKKADLNIADIFVKERPMVVLDKVKDILKAMSIPEEVVNNFENEMQKKLEFEHKVGSQKYTLPFESESEGTQRYLTLAGILSVFMHNAAMLSIDELESSLHPDLYTHFLLTFLVNSKQSQILATTHNREILNNKDMFRDDVIWFTQKNEHSATELYSLADFDSKVIRDTSNVYNAYKIGKLGGVPNLGDYYIDMNDEEK